MAPELAVIDVTCGDGTLVEQEWLSLAEPVHRQLRDGLPADYAGRLRAVFANGGRMSVATEAQAVRGVGVNWVRTVTRTYDLKAMTAALKEALTSPEPGPKVLVAQSECMLNKQRREKPLQRQRLAAGERVVRERFGVDADTCTGDHSCIRLSGCPSLTVKPNPDPLRTDPVAAVVDSCVGCGLCGEVSHAAVLCPSFYKARIVSNPTAWDRLRERVRGAVIGWLQRRDADRRARWSFGEVS